VRELDLAVHPAIDAARPARGRADLPLSRTAFFVSIAVHVVAGYALLQHRFMDAAVPPAPTEFFLFELPAPRSTPVPEPPAEAPSTEAPSTDAPAAEAPPAIEQPQPAPAPRAIEPAPEPEPTIVIEEPAPAVPTAPEAPPAPAPFIDFEEQRRRAANEVIGDRAAEQEYLTFSIDDVAPPRPEPKADTPSIFDGGGGRSRGPTVGQLGQARTKVGQKVSALCNALTGGFSLMGWGSFCAGPGDGGPSGFFPEVRPAYLDLMPECVDTRDTAPALALEAPFPTVKCRLVEREEPAE
jgi:hypothetical protein